MSQCHIAAITDIAGCARHPEASPWPFGAVQQQITT
jgi:hypothetical protein